MTLADRVKEHRARLGMSQADLAERLHVSRQAVTKWESGRGYPDLDNLAAMARLFGVSVDHLLGQEGGGVVDAVLRHPVDVAALEPYRPAGRPFGTRAHAAVREAHPGAVVHPLSRIRANDRPKEGLEWLSALLFDTPFGMFGLADGLSDRDPRYLVEENGRQLIARVRPDAVESRELPVPFTGRTLTLGEDTYRRGPRPL